MYWSKFKGAYCILPLNRLQKQTKKKNKSKSNADNTKALVYCSRFGVRPNSPGLLKISANYYNKFAKGELARLEVSNTCAAAAKVRQYNNTLFGFNFWFAKMLSEGSALGLCHSCLHRSYNWLSVYHYAVANTYLISL